MHRMVFAMHSHLLWTRTYFLRFQQGGSRGLISKPLLERYDQHTPRGQGGTKRMSGAKGAGFEAVPFLFDNRYCIINRLCCTFSGACVTIILPLRCHTRKNGLQQSFMRQLRNFSRYVLVTGRRSTAVVSLPVSRYTYKACSLMLRFGQNDITQGTAASIIKEGAIEN